MGRIYRIALRECGIMRGNPIYLFCLVLFPLLVIFFFTSFMEKGQPTDLPVGVVDLDKSSLTRALTRKLDAFQTTRIVAHYPNINEARKAIQQNKIDGFIYFPKNTMSDLLASRQPKISFYYNYACITSGSLVFRDLKTISMLGSAAVGSAKLSALGKTPKEIKAFLQPIAIDLHPLNNPGVNYNVYLSTALIPACLMVFFFLISAYSIGTELKFDRSKEWMALADNNIVVAMTGKVLPHFIINISIMYFYMYYLYGILGFPHAGSIWSILLLGLAAVLAGQGFGIFAFGLMPSLRMSMSICSLWAALSFSAMGSTFPISAMNPMIQSLAQLFPMRHYFMFYQTCIFNGYPISDAWIHLGALFIFAALPLFVLQKIKNAMLTYEYIP
ncbi:MAG: ABC transporter permease [Prevotella sp.]|nr:ABC transporter permease [Prevotella sp.]